MGAGWRRFTERMHQSGPTFSAFQPTSNARCSTMLREAAQFTVQLKRVERAVRAMAAANAGAAANIKASMLAPLPRRYEETAAGAGGAAGGAGVSPIGGGAFNSDAVTQAVQEAGHKLEVEVLAPLARWLEVYAQLGARHRDLEALRLEVDSRRRTVAGLSTQVDGLRARLGGGHSAKTEAKLQDAVKQLQAKRLQHKEGKLAAAAQSYAETERLLHRDLSTLVTDARWLGHYAAAALRLEGHALLQAAEAFGPMPNAAPPASQLAATVGGPAVAPALQSVHTPASSRTGSTAQLEAPAPQPLTPAMARFPVTAEPAGARAGWGTL